MTFINYICALAVRMSVFWFFLQFVSLFVCVAAGLFVSYRCFEGPFNLIYIYYNIEIYVVYAYSHSIIVYTHLCKLFTPQTILKTNHSKFNEVSSKSFIRYCFVFFLLFFVFHSCFTHRYCMFKKSWPKLYGNLLYKMGQDLLDIQYHLKIINIHYVVFLDRQYFFKIVFRHRQIEKEKRALLDAEELSSVISKDLGKGSRKKIFIQWLDH